MRSLIENFKIKLGTRSERKNIFSETTWGQKEKKIVKTSLGKRNLKENCFISVNQFYLNKTILYFFVFFISLNSAQVSFLQMHQIN